MRNVFEHREGSASLRPVKLPTQWLDRLCVIALGLIFYFYQRSGQGTPICFDDCMSYIGLMRVNGAELYWRMLTELFRPFPVPVIFSMFGAYSLGAASSIVHFQTTLSFIAWTCASASVASLFIGPLLRRATFFALALLMFSRGQPALNQFLLSDSLSMSLQLMMIACIARLDLVVAALSTRRPVVKFAGFLALALLAIFAVPARDTNVFLMLPLVMAAPVFAGAPRRREGWIVAVAGVMVCVCCMALSANRSNAANMVNVFAGRVLMNKDARDFFIHSGMPNAEAITNYASELEATWSPDPRGVALADVREGGSMLAVKARLEPLLADFSPRLRSVYLRYLLANAMGSADALIAHRDVVLQPVLTVAYTDEMVRQTPICESCSPAMVNRTMRIAPSDLVSLEVKLALGAACLVIQILCLARRPAFRRNGKTVAAGLAIAFGGGVSAAAGFFGDYWEVSEMLRHCLAGSVFFEMGLIVLIMSTINFAFGWNAAHDPHGGRAS